jgi:toxin ParE1/3/4
MRLIWSPEAIDDLAHLRRYIARENPAAAKRIVDAIVATTENRLTRFPKSGRPGRVHGTYELVIPRTPYIVPYRIGGDTVEIVRVYHGSRRWPDKL